MAVAARCDAAVINADSMQIYQDLRVLTARPSVKDETAVPHDLYGVADGAVRWSAGQWARAAAAAVSAQRAAGRVPLIVGGTGLYFKALLEGLAPIPEVPQAVFTQMAAFVAADPAAARAKVEREDPETAARLTRLDPQRVARALAVLEATGRPLSAWQAEKPAPPLIAGPVQRWVLCPPREALHERADARFAAMAAAGALDEVQALLDRRLPGDLPVMKAVGVRELGAHLAGATGLAEAIAEAQAATRRYIKRQTTWLRHQMPGWTWLGSPDRDSQAAEILREIEEAIAGAGGRAKEEA